MLIEKKVDPLAGELFFKYAVPVWDKLAERERKLAAKFVEDPVEGIEEILEYYEIEGYGELLDVIEECGENLLKMLLDYAEQKGWIWVDQGMKSFLWDQFFFLDTKEEERLEKTKIILELIKEKGLEKFLSILASTPGTISWDNNYLFIGEDMIYDFFKERKEILTIDEVLEVIDHLLKKQKDSL